MATSLNIFDFKNLGGNQLNKAVSQQKLPTIAPSIPGVVPTFSPVQNTIGGKARITGTPKQGIYGALKQKGADLFDYQQRTDDVALFKDLISKGVDPERAKRLINESKSGVGSRIKGAIASRIQTGAESLGTEKTGVEKGLSLAKDAASLPFDIIGGIVTPLIEPIVKPVMESEPVQSLATQYGQFRQENPRLAQNIEATVGLGTILAPGTKIGQKVINAPIEGVKKVAPIIKKPVTIIKNKASDIFSKEVRPVKDIAGNILQPYKGMVENLDDATSGLRRVVEETGVDTDTFQGLLYKIEDTQTKYGKMKQDSLSQINTTKQSVSAQKALENLDNVYANVSSKDMLATQARVKALTKKNMQEGLTPLEMDEVKILHTKANNLFNEKGRETGGFSSDDLRGIRKDLKEDIEVFAEENGVSNIREINKIYGEISDARTLAQNQVDNLTSYKGRQIPEKRVQKIVDFLVDFPVIKQLASDPARVVISSFFKNLRGDKINPIEVQKRLPEFLKELKSAGMKQGDLQKVEKMITNEVKYLPSPSGKPTSAKVVNVKPIELPSELQRNEITGKSVIRRPQGELKTKGQANLGKELIREKELSKITEGLKQATPNARYGGTGETKIVDSIKALIKQGKITPEEAKDIVFNIMDRVNEKGFSYMEGGKTLGKFIDELSEIKPIIKPTNEQPLNNSSTSINSNSPSSKINPFNLSKNKGGFIKLPEIGKDFGLIKKGDDLKPLIEEAKKYKSAEEFISSIGNDLYTLNKEAKGLKVSQTQKDKIYRIKNNLIKNIGEDSGEYHEFSRGGVGKLYKIGDDTFHDIMSKFDYLSSTNNEFIKKSSELKKEIGLPEDAIITFDKEMISPKMEIKIKTNEGLGSIHVYNKSEKAKSLKKELDLLAEKLKDEPTNLKIISPPKENLKTNVSQKEIGDIINKFIVLNISQKTNLTDIYNQAHKGIHKKYK